MISNFFIFVMVLSVLVFFHELGHFVFAKFFNVGIEKFSLGFGPRVFGFKIGITDYCVSAIPLGGYVKMVDDDFESNTNNSVDPLSFANKHVFKKILIVFAGPFFNILLALIIFFGIFSSFGVVFLKPVIGNVIENMPADESGLESGDIIISINQKKITNWDNIVDFVLNSNGNLIHLECIRNGTFFTTNILPSLVKSKNVFGQEIELYAIGITSSGVFEFGKISILRAFTNSLDKTINVSYLTILSILKLIQGKISTKTMGGPIMIAEMVGFHAKSSIIDLLFFVALLSINLAVLNCLPIPVLDGGHLLFFIIEAFIGKSISNKVRKKTQQFGALILLMLMIYVFYNDISRLLQN